VTSKVRYSCNPSNLGGRVWSIIHVEMVNPNPNRNPNPNLTLSLSLTLTHIT